MAYHKQTVARRSFARGAAQARRLIADTHIAHGILEATIEDTSIEQEVSYRLASEPMCIGDIVLAAMQPYYLVASRCAPGRYFAVVCEQGQWRASLSRDERCLAHLVAKAIEYRMALEVAA